jgi:hypothetical protein
MLCRSWSRHNKLCSFCRRKHGGTAYLVPCAVSHCLNLHRANAAHDTTLHDSLKAFAYAYETAKLERAKSTYRQAQVTIESNAHAKRLQAIYDAIGDMTIEQHNASVIKAHEAEKPSESTMLNVLADIRMITGLREKPMLLELAGEIGRLSAANKTGLAKDPTNRGSRHI